MADLNRKKAIRHKCCSWLFRHCIPYIRPFIDHNKWEERQPVHDWYHAKLLRVELEIINGQLHATKLPDESALLNELVRSVE